MIHPQKSGHSTFRGLDRRPCQFPPRQESGVKHYPVAFQTSLPRGDSIASMEWDKTPHLKMHTPERRDTIADEQKGYIMPLSPQAAFRILRAFTSLVFGLMLAACSTIETPGELPTALSVDLSRYGGMWHEIARLPMWGQRNCVTSTAEYRLLESGEVGVGNACVTNTGEEISIEGVATVVDREHRAKLNVVFDQWAAKLVALFASAERGNYWILRVDPDYQLAIVGTPDRDYLWILARTPTLDEATYQDAVTFSQRLGFPTERLIRTLR